MQPGFSPDQMIDALYAFTDCEVSISPNSCTIENDKPIFIPVEEMLRKSTDHTQALLQNELEIRKHELLELWRWCLRSTDSDFLILRKKEIIGFIKNQRLKTSFEDFIKNTYSFGIQND